MNKNLKKPKWANLLIIKRGALGDVVRTSFFAKALFNKYSNSNFLPRIYWLTSKQAMPLLRFNPYVSVATDEPNELLDIKFEEVFSLDDERETLSILRDLMYETIVGAYLTEDGAVRYCDRSAIWFDMGLISKFGKSHADLLKKTNTKTHSEIFKSIFNVDEVDFNFYNSESIKKCVFQQNCDHQKRCVPIGLNAFAGSRWPAKSLPENEINQLILGLTEIQIDGVPIHLYLFGSGADSIRNQELAKRSGKMEFITVVNTDRNILELPAYISQLKLLITADSLCLHFGIAAGISLIAFFAPTSAAEIENRQNIKKIVSTTSDYCSYKPLADNTTITAKKILEAAFALFGNE